MIDSECTFGTTSIFCDSDDCRNSDQFEGFDCQVDFQGAIKKFKEDGWIIKKVDGDWVHFCDKDCEPPTTSSARPKGDK